MMRGSTHMLPTISSVPCCASRAAGAVYGARS
jgi:hypothetical protein